MGIIANERFKIFLYVHVFLNVPPVANPGNQEGVSRIGLSVHGQPKDIGELWV